MTNSSFMRRMLGSVALLAALLGAGLHAGLDAHAASKGCRTDPVVVLTNGVVVDLSAAIHDDVTDVAQVTYILHVPANVGAAAVVTTDGNVQYHERFVLVNDSQSTSSGTPYTVAFVVDTRTPGISATATIAGGYAGVLGITPGMVGLSSFTTGASGILQTLLKKLSIGTLNVQVLPLSMNGQMVAWATSAAWAESASSGTAVSSSDQPLIASIVL